MPDLAPADMADLGEDAAPDADMGEDMAPDLEPDMCVASVTCADAPEGCGMIDDGCGVMLDCGPCTCTPGNFATFCPSRPCEVALGCDDADPTGKACRYTTVSCGGLLCACPPDKPDCGEDERRCTGPNDAYVCPGLMCAPTPMMVDGRTVYQNICADIAQAACDTADACQPGTCDAADTCQPTSCGLCGLGQWTCVAGPRSSVCEELRLPPGLDPALAQCDPSQPMPTLLFVDPAGGVDAPDAGTRDTPFKGLGYAIEQAATRGAKALIIAGSPTFTGTIALKNGVSIYGGFARDNASWTRDDAQRPVIRTGLVLRDNPAIGVIARDVSSPTVLSGLAIVSTNAGRGQSSYGIQAVDSPGLILHDVEVTAGEGGIGSAGATGATGATGNVGGSGSQAAPGAAGINIACPIANGGPGTQGTFAPPAPSGNPSPGGAQGGAGGPALISSGGRGQDGDQARLAALGAPGLPGSPTGYVDPTQNVWIAKGEGTRGGAGDHGVGGGGGGGAVGHPTLSCRFPGGSGGGGAGGCGGEGGDGGQPGGASIALLAVRSTGLTLDGVTLRGGAGGQGGQGGAGGQGGQGLRGGVGGTTCFGTSSQGGQGGQGGKGGAGGDGGGGAGGDSYGAYCLDTTVTGNGITATAGTPGAGGQGGTPGVQGRALDVVDCGF